MKNSSTPSPAPFSSPWYHGSPLVLTVLRAGSTITPSRDMARVFSHKPAIVSLDQAENGLVLLHNGTQPGFLYQVEDLQPQDVVPHPNSSMPHGYEWLTNRDLPLRLLETTQPRLEEVLTPQDVARLMGKHRPE